MENLENNNKMEVSELASKYEQKFQQLLASSEDEAENYLNNLLDKLNLHRQNEALSDEWREYSKEELDELKEKITGLRAEEIES